MLILSIPTRRIVDYIKNVFRTTNVCLVDEFETGYARHICHGFTEISILKANNMDVFLPDQTKVSLKYCACPRCGKVILDKSSFDCVTPSIPVHYNGMPITRETCDLYNARFNPDVLYGAYPNSNPFSGTVDEGVSQNLFLFPDDRNNY